MTDDNALLPLDSLPMGDTVDGWTLYDAPDGDDPASRLLTALPVTPSEDAVPLYAAARVKVKGARRRVSITMSGWVDVDGVPYDRAALTGRARAFLRKNPPELDR